MVLTTIEEQGTSLFTHSPSCIPGGTWCACPTELYLAPLDISTCLAQPDHRSLYGSSFIMHQACLYYHHAWYPDHVRTHTGNAKNAPWHCHLLR